MSTTILLGTEWGAKDKWFFGNFRFAVRSCTLQRVLGYAWMMMAHLVAGGGVWRIAGVGG